MPDLSDREEVELLVRNNLYIQATGSKVANGLLDAEAASNPIRMADKFKHNTSDLVQPPTIFRGEVVEPIGSFTEFIALSLTDNIFSDETLNIDSKKDAAVASKSKASAMYSNFFSILEDAKKNLTANGALDGYITSVKNTLGNINSLHENLLALEIVKSTDNDSINEYLDKIIKLPELGANKDAFDKNLNDYMKKAAYIKDPNFLNHIKLLNIIVGILNKYKKEKSPAHAAISKSLDIVCDPKTDVPFADKNEILLSGIKEACRLKPEKPTQLFGKQHLGPLLTKAMESEVVKELMNPEDAKSSPK